MFDSLYLNFKVLFLSAAPVIYISLFILSILRVIYLKTKKREIIFYKEAINFIFLFYFLCLFHIVTAQDINIYGSNNFTPFKEINRHRMLSYLYLKNVIGNIILFIPYGYLICKYLKNKNIIINFILISLASVAIEITQLLIARVFDIDDIILNVVGGLIGYFLYLIIEKIYSYLPKFIKNKNTLNIFFGIIIILLFSFILSLHI